MNNEANLKLAVFYTIGADVSMLESTVGTYTGSVYLSLLWKRVPDFGASEPSTPVYYIKLTFWDLVFFFFFFFFFFFINLFIYLFIFGCVRSSFLCEGSL